MAMSEPADQANVDEVEEERKRRQKSRSIAIALALLALVGLFYAATIVHLGANVANRPL